MPLSAATANVLRVLICFQPDNNGWFASFPIDSMLCCRFKNMLHKPLETFCEDKFDIFKQWSFAPMLQGTEMAPRLLESGWALISIFQGRHPIKGFIILRPEVFFSWQKVSLANVPHLVQSHLNAMIYVHDSNHLKTQLSLVLQQTYIIKLKTFQPRINGSSQGF